MKAVAVMGRGWGGGDRQETFLKVLPHLCYLQRKSPNQISCFCFSVCVFLLTMNLERINDQEKPSTAGSLIFSVLTLKIHETRFGCFRLLVRGRLLS